MFAVTATATVTITVVIAPRDRLVCVAENANVDDNKKRIIKLHTHQHQHQRIKIRSRQHRNPWLSKLGVSHCHLHPHSSTHRHTHKSFWICRQFLHARALNNNNKSNYLSSSTYVTKGSHIHGTGKLRQRGFWYETKMNSLTQWGRHGSASFDISAHSGSVTRSLRRAMEKFCWIYLLSRQMSK